MTKTISIELDDQEEEQIRGLALDLSLRLEGEHARAYSPDRRRELRIRMGIADKLVLAVTGE